MSTPQRIQLSRKKGFNLQAVSKALNGLPAVNCARPSRWGNPWRVGLGATTTNAEAVERFMNSVEHHIHGTPSIEEIKFKLRGKNLACFCALDKPCHCDVLLQIANS